MSYKQTPTIPVIATLRENSETCKYLVTLILRLIEK